MIHGLRISFWPPLYKREILVRPSTMTMKPKRIILPILLLSVALHAMPTPVVECPETELAGPSSKKLKLDVEPRCQLRISEIKLAANEVEEVYPFIELKTNCAKRRGRTPRNPLSSYKLIILQAKPLKFVMVVDFTNFIYQDSKEYVLIGSPKLENVDISLETTHIQSSFSLTNAPKMLPLQGEGMYAVMVLHDVPTSDGRDFNLWYRTDGLMESKTVTTKQVQLIKEHIVDMLVIGPENEIKQNQFSYFWKTFDTLSKEMFTSNWNNLPGAGPEGSMSMCDQNYKGFDASVFIATKQSPGEANICKILNSEPSDTTDNTESINLQTCQPSCHTIKIPQVIASQEPFNPSFVEACKNFFPKDDKTTSKSVIQEWLRFQTDPMCRFYCNACKIYLESGFRPDAKKKSNIMKQGYYSNNVYSNRDAIIVHQDNKIHEEAMLFYKKLKVAPFDEENQKLLIAEFESRERTTFNATMNVVLFLYSEMKSGLSFQTHETLMKALRMMGANVGWLQHTDIAAQGITKVFARTFHTQLLKKLVELQRPFSIVADSSTSGNQPYLAVYFQTLDEMGLPTTHFYSLVHMSKGEKAKDMVNALTDQIKEDTKLVNGFEIYFKSKLTSISSDGASVMTGNFKSFRVFLMEYIDRPIPNVVCLAHNLDRSYKIGIMQDKQKNKNLLNRIKEKKASAVDLAAQYQLTYFENFGKFIKRLYTYYQSRGHKKWQHFLKSADELDEIPKSMKYPYDIRWSETLYESLLAVHNNHYTMVFDVDEISEDDDFDSDAQNTAIDIHNRLTDKTFIFALHDLLDILSTFKKASKIFQTSSSTVTGKVGVVFEILESLTNLMTSPGDWLQGFLSNVACISLCDGGKCSLAEVDECDNAVIRGMKLQHQYVVVLPYNVVRKTMIENLMASIKKYFKLEMLESFEVFQPNRIAFRNPDCQDIRSRPNEQTVGSEATLESYYHLDDSHKKHYVYSTFEERLDYICRFYYFNNTIECGQLISEWKNVVACIVSTEELMSFKESDATIFWPKALVECPNAWTLLARKLVESVLVTSYTSSECERGFSIMNAIKTKSRSRLDKVTVDAIMKVKINGPDLEVFPTYEMTIEVLKSFARVDDPEFRNSRN